MKHLVLTLVIIIWYSFAYSQQEINIPIDNSTGLAQYSEVIRVEGASKDELYGRAKEWFARSFKSADAVLEMDDRVIGKLVGKANTTGVTYTSAGFKHNGGYFSYTIAIYLKEERFKYVIDDIFYKSNGELPPGYKRGANLATKYPDWGNGLKKAKTKIWQDFQQQTHSELMLIITSLKLGMLKANIEDDSW